MDFNWKSHIYKNTMFLKFLGLWPAGDDTYKFNLYAFYSGFCTIGLLCAHSFAQTYNIYFILNDLDAFTQSIYVTLACVGTVAKTYYLVINMTRLKQLFINIDDDLFQPKNEYQINLVIPNIKAWRFYYYLYGFSCCCCCFFWSAYPILDKWTAVHRLPFLAWYPYDFKKSPYYEFTYIHQVIGIWYLVACSLNTDCLISALNMFVGSQCDILSDNLKNLGRNNKDNLKQEIVRCVNHHRAIVNFAQNSNIFFNWIVLIQFFTSAISVGFSLFQLTLVEPFSSRFWSFVSYGFAITVEIFIYCWFGNEVEIKSSAVPYAVFESDWIGIPLSMQKNLLIFTLRTQRPIKMSALDLFYLSVDTFKTILRTSWSYFTVLNQVNNSP